MPIVRHGHFCRGKSFFSHENEAGKSPCLIADTSSNDYFSSVILVFGGCINVYKLAPPVLEATNAWKNQRQGVMVSLNHWTKSQKAKSSEKHIPSMGKGKSTSKVPSKWGICWFPGSNHLTIDSKGRDICSWNQEAMHFCCPWDVGHLRHQRKILRFENPRRPTAETPETNEIWKMNLLFVVRFPHVFFNVDSRKTPNNAPKNG